MRKIKTQNFTFLHLLSNKNIFSIFLHQYFQIHSSMLVYFCLFSLVRHPFANVFQAVVQICPFALQNVAENDLSSCRRSGNGNKLFCACRWENKPRAFSSGVVAAFFVFVWYIFVYHLNVFKQMMHDVHLLDVGRMTGLDLFWLHLGIPCIAHRHKWTPTVQCFNGS